MSKGLEAYEIVKEECDYAFGQTANGNRVRKNLPIIEKELKALEILKEVGGVAWERILKVWLKIEKINDEKHELLKEVLL